MTIRLAFERSLGHLVRNATSGFWVGPPTCTTLDSCNSDGLQVADFVAGAIFRSFERGDSNDLELFSGKTTLDGLEL
jgi:hypothetical protein